MPTTSNRLHDPRPIYKYTDAKGIAILRTLTLKASLATDFNDPFELSPRIDPAQFTAAKIRRTLLKPDRVEGIYRAIRASGRYPNKKQFKEHYRSTLPEQIRAIQSNLQQNVETVRRNFGQMFSAHWRIFCATRAPDSILMWSHYAGGHTGMLVQLDANNTKLTGWSPRSHFDVEYLDDKVDYLFDSDNVEGFIAGLFGVARRKAEAWSYEREVRYILRAPEDGGVLYGIEPEMILRVILGARSNAAFQQDVVAELAKPHFRHVLLERASLAKDKFGLEFASVDALRTSSDSVPVAH